MAHYSDRWRTIATKHYRQMRDFAGSLGPDTTQEELDEVVQIAGGAGVLAVALATSPDFREQMERDAEGVVELPIDRISRDTAPEDVVYAAWIAANAGGQRSVNYTIAPLPMITVAPGTLPDQELARYHEVAAGPQPH